MAIDDRRDLLEGHAEHVMQHKGDALGRRQRIEHGHQGRADRIGQDRLMLGIARIDASSSCVESGPSCRALRERSMPSAMRATTVVSQPPRLSTPAGVGTADSQPSVLHRIVRFAVRTEHAQSHGVQVAAMGFELLGEPVVGLHGDVLCFGLCLGRRSSICRCDECADDGVA